MAVLSSSGTTGLPKGVMLSDKNFLTVIRHLLDPVNGLGIIDNMMTLGLLPYFHAYAFVTLIMKLIAGAATVILYKFDEKVFLEVIQKFKIQHLNLVPPLMNFLAKHPLVDKYDLSCVKEIW